MADPSVQLADAVDLLTCVACEDRHTELFAVIVGVVATHSDELVPCDAQLCGIAAHVLAEQALVEIVVTGGYGSVHGVQR